MVHFLEVTPPLLVLSGSEEWVTEWTRLGWSQRQGREKNKMKKV
jgi:hypothetical protein